MHENSSVSFRNLFLLVRRLFGFLWRAINHLDVLATDQIKKGESDNLRRIFCQTLIRLELGHWITFRPFHRYSTYLSSFASSNRWKVVPIIYIRTNFPETAIWRDLIKLDTIDTHKRAVQPFINTRIKKNLERNTTADSFIKRKSNSWYRHP